MINDIRPRGRVLALVFGDGPGWEAQTGGYACNHRRATGILQEVASCDSALAEFFEDRWGGWCCTSRHGDGGIDVGTANFIDSQIPGFQTDRTRLEESEEAWVIGTFQGAPAVLTWENSD